MCESRHPSPFPYISPHPCISRRTLVYCAAALYKTPHPYRTLVFCVAPDLSIVPHYFISRRTLTIPPHPCHLRRTLTPYMLIIIRYPCLLCRIIVHCAAPSSVCASPSYIAPQPCYTFFIAPHGWLLRRRYLFLQFSTFCGARCKVPM